MPISISLLGVEIVSKLHYCSDGTQIVDKVLLYQRTRELDDYILIHEYYLNYKEKWYKDLNEYMDQDAFESDFYFKLYRAVDSFNEKRARVLCEKHNWGFKGAFNRWFYAILRNWKSNVKTSAFRQKKRPTVQCPVCGRKVPKIDEQHLQHYKSKSDLPRFVVWKNKIYSVLSEVSAFVVCWGNYSKEKFNDLCRGKYLDYTPDKSKEKWLWYFPDGSPGVLCPFQKNIVKSLNVEYIKKLPREFNRYARPISWQNFVEEYPYPMLIQSEVYSLEYGEDGEQFSDIVPDSSMNHPSTDCADMKLNKIPIEYEHLFFLIESYIPDEINQNILKLSSFGYSDEDMSVALDLSKPEVRRRKRDIKQNSRELQNNIENSF